MNLDYSIEVFKEYFGDDGLPYRSSSYPAFVMDVVRLGCGYHCFAEYLRTHYGSRIYNNQLTSRKIFSGFNKYFESLNDVARVLEHTDTEALRSIGVCCDRVKETLLDRLIAITPLYRFMVLMAMGEFQHSDQFRDKARRQLLKNPHTFGYYEKLRDYFPIEESEVYLYE